MSGDRLPIEIEKAAMKAYNGGKLEEAIDAFQAAERAYGESGDDAKVAEMANNRSVALLQANRPEEALQAAIGTSLTFEEHQLPLFAAQAVGNMAAALEALKRFEEARNHYRQCADSLGKLGAVEQQAAALQGLSRVQLQLGQPLPAVAALEAGLEAKSDTGFRTRLLRWLLSIPRRMTGQH